MKYDPQKHRRPFDAAQGRRSIRLPGYDYSQPGAYFITVCTHQRPPLFGGVVDGKMRLNGLGEIVQEERLKTAEIRSEIVLDEFIIMPNHIHGIIFLVDDQHVGDPGYPYGTKTQIHRCNHGRVQIRRYQTYQ